MPNLSPISITTFNYHCDFHKLELTNDSTSVFSAFWRCVTLTCQRYKVRYRFSPARFTKPQSKIPSINQTTSCNFFISDKLFPSEAFFFFFRETFINFEIFTTKVVTKNSLLTAFPQILLCRLFNDNFDFAFDALAVTSNRRFVVIRRNSIFFKYV